MLVCPGWISRDSSPDSSEGRCSRWKLATSRACRIFPGFSYHLGTELLSEKYVFLTWLCLKLVLASGCLAFSWSSMRRGAGAGRRGPDPPSWTGPGEGSERRKGSF